MVLLLLVSPGPPNRIGVEHAALVTMFSSLRGRPPASGYGMRTAMLRCWLVLETLQSRCSPQFWHTPPAPLTPPPNLSRTLSPSFLGGAGAKAMKRKMRTPAGTALHDGFRPPKGRVSLVLPRGRSGPRASSPSVPVCPTTGTRRPMRCVGLREGLRFRSLCLSGASSLSRPPLPPVGTCFSFFRPGGSGAEGEGVEGGEEGEEAAGVASLEPCV